MIKELVVISGKGGTGKTSVTACFSSLADNKVIADCDVDAADLHLLLRPVKVYEEEFIAGKKAWVDPELCMQCGQCVLYCRFDAFNDFYVVNELSCEGCGVCVRYCPHGAIEMREHVSGKWFISDTPAGKLVHAKLGIAEGNSGKLVSIIKKKAKEIAAEKGHDLILVDGSPGTGCPVIATISGSTMVLVVTEPTVAGIHDLKRVCALARHFRVKTAVCVNKADINQEKTAEIELFCNENGIPMMAKIPYDDEVTRAQIKGITLVEHSDSIAAREITSLWERVHSMLEELSA